MKSEGSLGAQVLITSLHTGARVHTHTRVAFFYYRPFKPIQMQKTQSRTIRNIVGSERFLEPVLAAQQEKERGK